ncbi:transglutaminaseTgpA domain-containing protein [Streptomyces sp. NPDC029004]|uniref:transglutaminase TgpA family protein n=1 Tax=Streptomyces sp. NPDC029004 TaxID=3154490 RepID=UPI0033E6BA56
MSGRGRLALCAYAATLMAAGAMLPLIEPASWMLQAVFLLAIVSGVGALARRVPLARPLTVAVQALVLLLLLTILFARSQAILGVLPGPDAFQRFGELLNAGGEDVGRYAIPAPATDGIRLMVLGGVLVIGLAVDALAVTFRSAAPAGLPLLALYSVAAGLSGGGASWLWFLLAATGYLVLLLAEGRDRLSQWGRVFGGAATAQSPTTGRYIPPGGGQALAPVRTGRRIGALALGVALVVPAALPALDGGLLNSGGNGNGSGQGGGTISAVNPLVSLQDSLNQPEDREVIRYNTNTTQTKDLYLRIVALDQFDGTAWKTSQRDIRDVPNQLPQAPGLSPSVAVTEIRTNVSAAGSYKQSWLPLPYPATKVAINGRWRFEPEGRTLVGDRGQDTRGAQYSVTSLMVKPTAEQLSSAPRAPAKLLSEYTKVPDALPGDVRNIAKTVTKGATNDYARAVKLQDWFAVTGGFRYDTKVESGTGAGAISRFLKRKEGFCIHFSFSMAAMARTLGIPARVAVGFTPGSPLSDGSMSVGLQEAHAWPELYFEGVGWTRFEPTPSRGTPPDYTRPQSPSGGPSTPAEPEGSASAEPSTAPSETDNCPPQARRIGDCGAAAPQEVAPPTDPGTPASTWVGLGLGVVALVLVPLLPMLWRIRTRARRLRSGSGAPAGAADPAPVSLQKAGAGGPAADAGRALAEESARTLATWQEISDLAWDHGILPDESQTPRKAAARIIRLGRLEDEPADAVHRVARAVEQVLYAPEPRPVTGLGDDVQQVRAGLRAAASRGTRLRALLAPRSTVRVFWGASARWTAFTDRWGVRATASRWGLLDKWPGILRRPSRQRG